VTDPVPPIYPYFAPQPAARETNGLAIASLAVGLTPLFPVAAGLGIAALVQIRRTGQAGRGLAIGGLVAAGVWFLIIVASVAVGVVVGLNSGLTKGFAQDKAQTQTQTQAPRTFVVGECLNDLNGDLDSVPCGPPHDGEVYANFDLPAGAYPGYDTVMAQSKSRCGGELAIYMEESSYPQAVDYIWLYPPESSWTESRTVTCVAWGPDGQLFGSIRD
jgi:putative regulator of septum formation